MPQPDQSSPEQPPSSRPRRLTSFLFGFGATAVAITAAGSIVVFIWGNRIINAQVLPRLETVIAETIGRPIDLGEVERLVFWGVRLGKTTVPPTATDGSYLTVDAVDVKVDLRSLIWQRTLRPTAVLVRPDVFLEQGEDGAWLEFLLPEPSEDESFVSLELQSVEVQDARLTVETLIQDPQDVVQAETVQVENADIRAEFFGEAAQQFNFTASGDVATGRFDIEGEADLAERAMTATVRAQDLPVTGVNLFLPSALGVSDGLLNTNLQATAALTDAGELDQTVLDLQGMVRFRDGAVAIAELAEPIRNIRSQLQFRGQQVTLENTGLQVGDIALTANGTADLQTGYDITAQIPTIALAEVQRLAAVELPVDVDGTLQLTTRVTGDLTEPRLQGQLTNAAPLQVDAVTLAVLAADFDLTRSRFDLTEVRLVPEAGGVVLAQGQADLTDLDDPRFQLTAQATDLPVDAFASVYGVTLPEALILGALTAAVEAEGTLTDQTATAEWQLAESSFPAQGVLTLADNTVTTDLQIRPQEGGAIVAAGQADLSNLDDPSFQFTAQATDLPVDAFAATYGVALPADIVLGTLAADVEATGTFAAPIAFAQWQLAESTFPGQGELTFADNTVIVDNTRLQIEAGTVTAAATAELDTGSWQATVATDQIPVDRFTTQAEGLLSAELTASGNLNTLDLAAIEAGGNATIADAQVRLTEASEPLLDRGDWQTTFEWQGDRVAIADFTAPGLQAAGVIGVDWTQAIPIGAFDLTVALQEFDLQPLNSLAPATVQDYAQIAGFTSFDGTLTGTLADPQLQGEAQLAGLTLNQLVFETLTGPIAVSLTEGGSVDLQGTQDRLQLAMDARPAPVMFWPVTFAVRNQEFLMEGYGEGDRLYADITQLPLSQLAVQPAPELGFGTVAGVVDASLAADLSDWANPSADGTLTITDPALDPVAAQQITASFRYADGTATLEQSELQLDNSRFLLTGSASLTPALQYEGELTIAEGHIEDLVALVEALDLTALGFAESAVALGSAADLRTEPAGLPATGSFLERLESFAAFVRAQPDTNPVAGGGTIVIPPLADLTGGFTGTITVAGKSPALEDVTAAFDIQGDQWQWGPYAPANQFSIQGDVQQATLTLEPVMIAAGDTLITLSGRGGWDELTGQLQVEDLPVELVQSLYPLPVAVAGDLDLVTNFDGSLTNPIVAGEARLSNTQIEAQEIDQAGANFSYRNATLTVDAAAAIDPTDDPITLEGRIPYALPFMTVQPPIEQLAVMAVVPSDSFDVINTLTEGQVRWEAGNGEVTVQVGGTLDQPVVAGAVNFREGVIASDLLTDPVTNLTGTVLFSLERFGIPQLQANLGDGQIDITGQLPLLPSGQSLLTQVVTKQVVPQRVDPRKSAPNAEPSPSTDGLLIALTDLPVGYSNIFQAVLNGQVAIDGAALEPVVGGQLEIGGGQVRATELLRQIGAIDFPTPAEVAATNPYRAQYLGIDPLAPQPTGPPPGLLDKLSIQDFRVVLSDRFVVAGQPFYNVSAVGDVTINGTLADLQPDGMVALTSGWINLFSTQFRLDPNAPNTATFTPANGLDPYVDVVMTARIRDTDVTQAPRVSGGFAGSELSDNTNLETVGDIEYVQVRAIAQGPASELNESLALTSRPRRRQEELVALLGSSVSGRLAGASLTQFAGFVGAGSLSGFGNNVANALGLRSFSVFPTTDTSTESTAGIGLGVEASFGIGNRLGVNILQILNNGNPPQVGIQYRLTEQLQLRGSSNLNDTEVRLEYRRDF